MKFYITIDKQTQLTIAFLLPAHSEKCETIYLKTCQMNRSFLLTSFATYHKLSLNILWDKICTVWNSFPLTKPTISMNKTSYSNRFYRSLLLQKQTPGTSLLQNTTAEQSACVCIYINIYIYSVCIRMHVHMCAYTWVYARALVPWACLYVCMCAEPFWFIKFNMSVSKCTLSVSFVKLVTTFIWMYTCFVCLYYSAIWATG